MNMAANVLYICVTLSDTSMAVIPRVALTPLKDMPMSLVLRLALSTCPASVITRLLKANPAGAGVLEVVGCITIIGS
jgi:hypothetical protein